MKGPQKSGKGTSGKGAKVFRGEERAAITERAREVKAAAGKADGERDALASIAAMREPDRAMAKRLPSIIKASAPTPSPKTWYGMPADAKGGKVVCFFPPAQKGKTRYATVGLNDSAHLDEGAVRPGAV